MKDKLSGVMQFLLEISLKQLSARTPIVLASGAELLLLVIGFVLEEQESKERHPNPAKKKSEDIKESNVEGDWKLERKQVRGSQEIK